ncbi:MAG: hypothetical protein K1X94_31155 [Sandaracinaceae bacterium]|nr:hypothetical protein [Sandaracinaceae bacterium]
MPSIRAGHEQLLTVECGAQGLLCGTLVDDGGGACVDCGACSHELTPVVGDFEQIAADRRYSDPPAGRFFAVQVEAPTRWLVLIEPDGTVTRLLEIGDRPIVSLIHRHVDGDAAFPVWMLDDQGTITIYQLRDRSLHRATAEELGFRARALQWTNRRPVAELCDPSQTDACHLRGLLELEPEGPPTVRREIMMLEEDLAHASIGWERDQVNETVCWAFESDRRLRCTIDGTEVVWPPPASGVAADAFRHAERRGLQIIDNTCTVVSGRAG